MIYPFFPMFALRSLFPYFLFLMAVPVVAQQMPVVEPGADGVALEVRRAIPVELPSPVQFLPLELEQLPRTLPEGFKTSYARCEVAEPAIAITFDDGPHPQFTPKLLDMLKERNIKATFFLVGRNVANFPAIVKRMAEEGHEVASHTWSHPLLTGQSATSVNSQLSRTHEAIVKACGIEPVLYRPPYGGARLTQRRAIQEKFGYSTILWDVDPLDWQSPRTVQKVYDRVLSQTKVGSIVLLHDIHESTVDAMPATLDALIERGLKMVTVSQLINLEAQQAAKPSEIALVAGAEGGAEDAVGRQDLSEGAAAAPSAAEVPEFPALEPEPTASSASEPGRAGSDPASR
jgi:peptidoglycan/xylan/chitin deacetylase (PgdA/CDA1 family)